MIDKTILETAESWLSEEFDAETRNQVKEWIDNKDYNTITDAFYKGLEFGTGGLRGIMGPGTNRVNKYTIGMATQGLCNHLNNKYSGESISVAISYDSRNNSSYFAKITADVFTANGIKVYFFNEMRPTPQLSFAIRAFGCKSGVMLTASHNPKEYNGYKAYGNDGCQVTSPEDQQIIEQVNLIESINQVKFNGDNSLFEIVNEDFDIQYHYAVLNTILNKQIIQDHSDLKIVFSPIHGTGAVSVPNVLSKMGFKNIINVEEQMIPDGNFPTVVYPNPEEEEALTMALNKAKEVDADIVMATDPDADRVGIAVKNGNGEFVLLNGNQTAALIFNFAMNSWKLNGKIDGNQYIVKTIVTTYLLDEMAKHYGVKCYNTLTGFKHMGTMMTSLEGKEEFIVGGEESYGYLVGDHARDKDAVVSCAVLAEMCAYYKSKGLSLYSALQQIYETHGLYVEKLVSVKKEGKKGADEIRAMMNDFRTNPPSSLAGEKVVQIKDFLEQTALNTSTQEKSVIDLPVSNVLQFITEKGTRLSARPSGTEPKIKFYCSVNDEWDVSESYESASAKLKTRIDGIMKEMELV